MGQFQSCSVCSKSFTVRFSFQVQRTLNQVFYFCSQTCHERQLSSEDLKDCTVCKTQFEFAYAYQQLNLDEKTYHFCSESCRQRALNQIRKRQRRMRKIAVLNQKGGTGKTTTSVNLSAGLATLGYKVLLIDLDAQSNVGVSLGVKSKYTMSDILSDECHPSECIVKVSPNLDVIISSASLSVVETDLVQFERARHEVLSQKMKSIAHYDFVILDCSPSLSILNQNTLTYADHVLIPVSCDYLSLVGVRNIMRALKEVNEVLLSHVDILGLIPTFYGLSEQCTLETMKSLKAFFKDKVLTPIRVDPALRQAPMHKKTIFEYAPQSHGAQDYQRLANQLVQRCMAMS
jgi:chromosome partitioning protein